MCNEVPGAIYSNAAVGGEVPRALGTKCIVAGCSNRVGNGGFRGEVCMPCYRMLVTGSVTVAGETFVHSMQRTLAMAAEQRYLDRATALLDIECKRTDIPTGMLVREQIVRLLVNALKEGERNAEEGKRQSS